MYKKILAVASLGLALTASADVLLWQVSSNPIKVNLAESSGTAEITYSYAQIKQTTAKTATDGTALSNLIGDYDGTATSIDSSTFGLATVAAIFNSDYASSSFYIELFDSANKSVAVSTLASYDDITAFTASSQFSADWASKNSWTGGTFTATPEPTSGLLMVLGAALLALRRRKMA